MSSAVQINKLINRMMQVSTRGGFSGGDVTKDIRVKNEAGIIFYDSDDEDSIRVQASDECDNYTLLLPESVPNEGDVLRVQSRDSDDPDRPVIRTEFGNLFNQALNTSSSVTFGSVTTSSAFPDQISMGPYFFANKDSNFLLNNSKGNTRLAMVTNPANPTSTVRYSVIDRSCTQLATSSAGQTITLDAGSICMNGFVYVRHSGCTIQLPSLSLSIDTGYNAGVVGGAGTPAINNFYTVHICGDGANTFTIGNGNSPSGYTFINRSLPYTSPTVFSVVRIHFIRTSNAPNYNVIIE